VECLVGARNDDTNLVAGDTDDGDELARHYELFEILFSGKSGRRLRLMSKVCVRRVNVDLLVLLPQLRCHNLFISLRTPHL
jgi:hypothetical protein